MKNPTSLDAVRLQIVDWKRRLRKELKAAKVTQLEIAGRMECRQSHVQRNLVGDVKRVDAATILAMAAVAKERGIEVAMPPILSLLFKNG